MKNITINGPFWSAVVDFVELADVRQNAAFRNLFIDQNQRTDTNLDALHLPGTQIVLCFVKSVSVQPEEGITYTWNLRAGDTAPSPGSLTAAGIQERVASGNLALLIVQAHPDTWSDSDGFVGEMTCLAGEVLVDRLAQQGNARNRLFNDLGLATFDSSLSNVQAQLAARTGAAGLLGEITTHASGVSLYGQVHLPWEDEDVFSPAPFRISRIHPVEEDTAQRYELKPEFERFTESEASRWERAWLQLSRDLNPRHPRNGITLDDSELLPHWVTLELVNPRSIPDLFWDIVPWGATPLLNFKEGELSLILSDRHPYDPLNPPITLARVVPETILIRPVDDAPELLEIKIGGDITSESPNYQWGQIEPEGEALKDQLTLNELALAFSPIETPERLRNAQQLPAPDWSNPANPIEPAAVWGFVPLENGWAQLPVPNFNEQIFLDSELENASTREDTNSRLRGVVAYGNEDAATLQERKEEQPWNLTITRLATACGSWHLKRLSSEEATSGRRYHLHAIELEIIDPEIILNGLFWLSTGKPRTEDALPDMEDWVNGLTAIPLRTHKPELDLFPSPVFLMLDKIVLGARSTTDASANLDSWRASYEVDEGVFGKMTEIPPSDSSEDSEPRQLLPKDFFELYKAWAWLRHPTLPMIQALPMTQNELPPNTPNRSRQLVPFELPVDDKKQPDKWAFGVADGNGASRWPQLSEDALPAPAQEWLSYAAKESEAPTEGETSQDDESNVENTSTELHDLPLIALSLPGLVLDARASEGLLDGAVTGDGGIDELNPQLRYDLPYTDQVNALAQLPPEPKAPDEVSPLPDSTPPAPPAPLTRETFATHWLRMSELASLARTDATDTLAKNGNAKHVKNLVEPLTWSVDEARVDVSNYPGSISIKGTDGVAEHTLEEEAALRGISGVFHDQQDGTIGETATDGAVYEIEAGSMAAAVQVEQVDDDTSLVWYRDQRGLARAASNVGQQLLRTPVKFAAAADTPADRYDLTTALTAFPLRIGDNQWQLWFKDLPAKAGVFTRTQSATATTQDLDINDPEASTRSYNFLTGYEWRLGDASGRLALPCFGLHFYPLTLVEVTFNADTVSEIKIDGRLQLPLDVTAAAGETPQASYEQTEFSNIVRITFKDGVIHTIEALSSVIEWPLALAENEVTNAPILCSKEVRLTTTDESPVLNLDQVQLKFFHFGTNWTINEIPVLGFNAAGTGPDLVEVNLSDPADSSPIKPGTISLALHTATGLHEVSLSIDIALGRERVMADANAVRRSSFTAQTVFNLLADDDTRASWESATLFDDVELDTTDTDFLIQDTSMQFHWLKEKPPQATNNANAVTAAIPEDLQLLPGMFLKSGDAPGFAALTFSTTPQASGIPRLVLETAFIEALLHSQWSQFLQDAVSPVETTPDVDPIFDSSAGDLFFGYTAEWAPSTADTETDETEPDETETDGTELSGAGTWQEVLLLNGFLEVKNLVSWPTGMTLDPDRTKLTLPARQAVDSLAHYRHSIRMLFNQHQIPVDLIVVGSGNLLFEFAQDVSWQFLAVVEHQVIEVQGDVLGLDRRWTTVQEVRIASPDQFKTFLQRLGSGNTLLPTGAAEVGSASYGYLTPAIRARLSEGENAELDKLNPGTFIVEASAPHWINLASAAAASETTLQFLPNGMQEGVLSRPENYGPTDPKDPQWLLLSMPFIGRLQNDNDPAVVDADTPLHLDPIKYLSTAFEDKSLASNLTSWGDDVPVDILLSGFDTTAGRTWSRLDPNTLQESWFRIQHPVQEPEATGLQSVMAALPDTPARLSRSAALHQLFNVHRRSYPPTVSPDTLLQTQVASSDPIEWRPESWFVPQEVSRVTIEDNPEGLLALYTFEEGSGSIVRDRSGSATPLDLQMQKRISFPDNWVDLEASDNHAAWVEGGGLEIVQSMILRSVLPATALNQACKASNEITIEAWIRPADVPLGVDDPARIVSLAESTSNRNATLGYERGNGAGNVSYETSYRLENGGLEYKKTTFQASATVEDRLHVVYVHENTGISRMYLNGVQITQRTDAGDFSNWIEDFHLVLANEITGGDVPWRGTYFLLALYERALQPDEIESHFSSGTVKGRTLDNAFKWYAPGMHLLDSGLITTRDDASEVLRSASRHAAATLLPAARSTASGDNPTPVSFAVSPYLGLGLKKAVDPYTPLLVSAELLCLDQATGTLLPVASHFLTADNKEEESIKWAEETHRKLCPDSPFAILRFREINERDATADIDTTVNEATLTATYGYAILKELAQPEKFARRVFPLRSTVTDLRFREGQFGGPTMPVQDANPDADTTPLNLFEYAPPQAVGVQPLYIPGLWRVVDVDPKTNEKLHFVIIAQQGTLTLYGPSSTDDNEALVHFIAQQTDKTTVRRLKASLERNGDTLNEELQAAFQIPSELDPEVTEPALTAAAVVHRSWPWGMSGLRMQVAYGAATSALIDEENPIVDAGLMLPEYIGAVGMLDENEGTDRTLWWQSQPYQVQYRAALSGRPVAGLPKHFRAEAIKGFLPVLPTPPMPAINVSDEQAFNAEAAIEERWQAVLPGLMRYMVVGDRPGVPFAFRNQLIRQDGFEAGTKTQGNILVSGSMPVQHRMPRPVTLPHTGRRERALLTWASYFEPNQLLSAETVPTDEAFFANCGGFDALRFKMKLINPNPGALGADWNNDLLFSIIVEVEGGNPAVLLPPDEETDESELDPDTVVADFIRDHIEEWISIEIANGDEAFSFTFVSKDEGNAYLFRPVDSDKTGFESFFGGLAPGSVLTTIARIGHPSFTDDYYQTMPFRMHRIDESKFRLPLQPYYLQFEDPEYNRRLSSAATQGTRNMKINVTKPDGDIDKTLSTVTFATDRKAYNPDSLLSLRFDWEQDFASKGFLKIEKIEAGGGNPILLNLPDPDDSTNKLYEFELEAGKLKQIKLNALEQETTPAELTTGITLQLTLLVTEIQETDVSLFEEQVVILNVDIVEEAIIPKPEAAYGLLRAVDASATAVECARFAWGPEANRIDLICPDDLRTGIVRRRAVFKWTDTVRPNPFKGYTLQKITQTGSTHFPDVDDFVLTESTT